MKQEKELLRERFSSNYKKYYLVDLFKRKGFVRKKCENCGKFFWTLDGERKRCDDQPCSPYTFIGSPPTKRKLDYVDSWREIERFFIKNKHAIVKRYPVVSRWRPDLYFTVASIIDFQRIEAGKVVFELPANPLVVPQMCLRFNDIPTVGVNGKHGTSFCMVGQTALADKEGYWKDRCIDLDFELLTKVFGIPEEEVTFIEQVWLGYGAFGYSLEYLVRGLETGNAVFTAFEGTPAKSLPLKVGVVDMGAGLERFTWLTQGTPTAYDSYLSSVLKRMRESNPLDYDGGLFTRYSKLAGIMNLDEYKTLDEARQKIAKSLGVSVRELTTQFGALEAQYAIADHARTLLFAIADGMLPSNTGGGYNLRMIFRRAMNFIRHYGFHLEIPEVATWHIDYLSRMYPELKEHREDVAKILGVEGERYYSSSERAAKIVSTVSSSGRSLTTEELVRLYDSDGVTPEQLDDAGARVSVPENFYEQVLARHITKKVEEERPAVDVKGAPPTKLLYYEDVDRFDFKARVLKVLNGEYVVLDRTAFYPRGGGQEPDHGTIDGAEVTDVEKYGGVVIHRVTGKVAKSGLVACIVNGTRRQKIMKIHTATHILNGSSREVLGPWVWQNSAFKEENYGRLDITHHAHLTQTEVQKIEDMANDVVRKNLPVSVTLMPRGKAEAKYGFRLYQGGVVPTKILRVINIGGWDIEACGGTHTKTTGEVGLIKIVKVEKVQDGVERLEFVAGEPAMKYLHQMESTLDSLSSTVGTQRENLVKVVKGIMSELDDSRNREKALSQRLADISSTQLLSSARQVKGVKVYVSEQAELGEEHIIVQGQKATRADPFLVFASVLPTGKSVKIICFVGAKAVSMGISANAIVKRVSAIAGGSGGGSPSFAQGGGPLVEKAHEVATSVEEIVASLVRS